MERSLTLLRRESLDLFNIAFMRSALDHDQRYLEKIGENVARLKGDGLIRFAGADTFSGERTHLAQTGSGVFDHLFVNFSFADGAACVRGAPSPSRIRRPR